MSYIDAERHALQLERNKEVCRVVRRDAAVKARILAASPHLYSMDSVAEMSSRELAAAELKGYGVKVSDNSDPIEVRDAFHAGRMHERQHGGGSAAHDSAAPSRVRSIVEKYLLKE